MTIASPDLRTLVGAVRAAIDDAEHDLGRMPFFIRPMAKGGFSKRTGLSFDGWREKLGAIKAQDTAAEVRRRWPEAESALGKLVENFRGAPDRAKSGMGSNAELLKEVTEKSRVRAAAAQALLDWLR